LVGLEPGRLTVLGRAVDSLFSAHLDPASIDSASADTIVRPIAVGGADLLLAPLTQAVLLSSTTPPAVAPATLLTGRYGATVTALDGGRAVVWGGHFGQVVTPNAAGELLSGLGPGQEVVSLSLDIPDGSLLAHRAFHSAVRVGDQVLIVGGFDIAPGTATILATSFAELITVQPFAITEIPPPGGAAPIGYLSAVALADGNALITGGNTDCPNDPTGAACSSAATYRFDQTPGELRTLGSLQVSRYGHRVTVLDDGTALVTGGLHGDSGQLRTATDVELIEPDTSDAVRQFMRAPGSELSRCQVIGIAEP
ncbi:MAG: hypothetical protein AAGC55_27680, partial [Myxococcota bacterium]